MQKTTESNTSHRVYRLRAQKVNGMTPRQRTLHFNCNQRTFDKNYHVLKKQRLQLCKKHGNGYVLMEDGKILGVFADENAAWNEGLEHCISDFFYVFEIQQRPPVEMVGMYLC